MVTLPSQRALIDQTYSVSWEHRRSTHWSIFLIQEDCDDMNSMPPNLGSLISQLTQPGATLWVEKEKILPATGNNSSPDTIRGFYHIAPTSIEDHLILPWDPCASRTQEVNDRIEEQKYLMTASIVQYFDFHTEQRYIQEGANFSLITHLSFVLQKLKTNIEKESQEEPDINNMLFESISSLLVPFVEQELHPLVSSQSLENAQKWIQFHAACKKKEDELVHSVSPLQINKLVKTLNNIKSYVRSAPVFVIAKTAYLTNTSSTTRPLFNFLQENGQDCVILRPRLASNQLTT